MIQDAVSAWAKERGISFREFYYRGEEKPLEGLRQERIGGFKEVLSQIDVMIIFPPGPASPHSLLFHILCRAHA